MHAQLAQFSRMYDLKEIQNELTARRMKLLGREERLESDIRHKEGALEADFEEQAVQQENDQVLDALDSITRAEITEIDSALGRIRSGTFGVCTSCGQSIEHARIRAMPTADRCISCAAKT